MNLIGSPRGAESRTVWHIPLVVGIPLIRQDVGAFITTPFRYPDMDHEALLTPRVRINHGTQRAEHPIRQAMRWEQMMAADSALTQSQLALKEGVSRARICQLMRMLSLPAEIKTVLAGLRDPSVLSLLNERRMRDIAELPDEQSQLMAFSKLHGKGVCVAV